MNMRTWQVWGVLAAAGAVAAGAAEWEPLFNGRDLAGWERLNGTAEYRVEDGAIVGTTTPGSPNSFLCTTREFGDFELEFEVKVDDRLNSGVQVRSRLKDGPAGGEGRYFGPQVEIEASPGQAGYVYGEAMGGGWLSPEPTSGTAASAHDAFRNGEWNAYRVVAEGPRIRTYINGRPVADLVHEGAYATHPRGSIGLQVHSVPRDQGPYEVRWRNLRIKAAD